MDDAGDLAFELGLDGDDEALAADGDEVFGGGLGAAFFAERACGTAERGFDGSVLVLHGAADAAEFGTGVVGEGAIGFDFAAEGAEERGEVVGKEVLREGEDGWAKGDRCLAVAGFAGEEEVAPGGDALGYFEECEDFEGFEGGAADAGFFKKRAGVEEPVEAEGAAAGEEGAELGGAGELGGDPGEVGAGLEGEGEGAAERAYGFGCDAFAEARPLQGGSAGFEEGRGDVG